MTDLLQTPMSGVVQKLARKELSALELMTETLARIEDTQEAVNAFVALRDAETGGERLVDAGFIARDGG